ncbi:MAG: hypothetical protein CMJ81_09365 [Planctomycetaceae bacterium]|nr:hypothetical protein [Planctomycetaceae bacterium]MBP61781.1 hypothetical protein [Planctomycetaceae bacterium]
MFWKDRIRGFDAVENHLCPAIPCIKRIVCRDSARRVEILHLAGQKKGGSFEFCFVLSGQSD